MTPEELATLFKRRGDFDSTRKDLLVDFQNSDVGQQFTLQLDDILQECIDRDSSLLQRDKSEFHQMMVERITKSSEYKKVQQFVDSLLQPAQYMSKIESKLRTIVQEQAPPEPTIVEEASGSSKATSALTTSRSAKESKESRESKGPKNTARNGSDTIVKRESSSSTQPETSTEDVAEKSIRIKEESDVNAEENNPDSTKAPNARSSKSSESSSRKTVPKKRNSRRQSMDSNSSLSSPPPSSDQDSDHGSRGKEGRRAKKLSKKAAHKDKTAAVEPNDESTDFVSISGKVDTTVRTDDDMAMDVSGVDTVDTKEVDGATRIDTEDLKTSTAESKQSESKSTNGIEVVPASEKMESSPKGSRDSTSDKSHRDHKHSPSSSMSTPPIRSPAATGANSVSVLRRRESDSVEKRLPRDHPHGHTAHKRIPHQPLPLPPRPMVVPLPPKPTPKLSIPRRPSHSRSTSNTGGTVITAAGSAGAGNSPSNTIAASALSPVSSTPPAASSSNRFGGRFKSDLENHVPLHPSLPPPPLNLQHPLPPPPRLGLPGSRSLSHSSKTTAVIGSPPSSRTPPSTTTKPRISTSHSSKSPTEVVASVTTLTTPTSATSSTVSGAEEKTESTQEPTVESKYLGLKSPDANGSSGSHSSNGSLASSTGSLSTDASENNPLNSTAPFSEEKPSITSKLGAVETTVTGTSPTVQNSAMEVETSSLPVAPQPDPPVTPPAAPAPPPPPTPPPQSSTGSDAGSSEEGALMESPPLRPISPIAKLSLVDRPSSKPDTSVADPSILLKSPPRVPPPASSSPSSSASSPSSSGTKARHAPSATSGAGGTSTPSASLSTTPGSGRATIPLPHKPIPLPPKPSGATAGSSTLGASGGHGRHHHHHGGAGHRKYRH